MTIRIGIPRETSPEEARVAATPESVKRLRSARYTVCVEKGLGHRAGFSDAQYSEAGAELTDAESVWKSDIVFKINKPAPAEISKMKTGALLFGFLDPFTSTKDGTFQALGAQGINAFSMELIPRTSRAQSMDALSSQANIAGYCAVLEASRHYPRFFPMMMTSAGSAKPARVCILGVGVAGLQAIGTARRLGAQVEAFDVRPEVAEQIRSLGAKVLDLQLGEENGAGAGGYAKELSNDAKRRQQEQLTEKLKKFDVVITTANIPGRRAPILIEERAVQGMRPGSVIVDLAAPTGGNCALTEPGKTVQKNGVTIIGALNFPSLLPADASQFFAKNLENLLALIGKPDANKEIQLSIDLADDILAASLVTQSGVPDPIRFQEKKS